MSDQAIRILTRQDVDVRLRRMAYEIYESHYGRSGIVLIGIDERGGFLAEKLLALLQDISPLQIEYLSAHLDRQAGDGLLGIDLGLNSLDELQGKEVVVVDDVLYSGATLLNVVSILLQARPNSIQTVVLIDRGHRTLPVAADVIGLQLATTIQQHVTMQILPDQQGAEAFLS